MSELNTNTLHENSDAPTVLKAVAKLLDSKKAENILILDISEISSDMSYFLIATSLSTLHIKNLCNEVMDFLREQNIKPVRTPLLDVESGWIPLDYGEFIIHLFSHEKREYYQLDTFWQNGKPISWQYTPSTSESAQGKKPVRKKTSGKKPESPAKKSKKTKKVSTKEKTMATKKPAKKAAKKTTKKVVKKKPAAKKSASTAKKKTASRK